MNNTRFSATSSPGVSVKYIFDAIGGESMSLERFAQLEFRWGLPRLYISMTKIIRLLKQTGLTLFHQGIILAFFQYFEYKRPVAVNWLFHPIYD